MRNNITRYEVDVWGKGASNEKALYQMMFENEERKHLTHLSITVCCPRYTGSSFSMLHITISYNPNIHEVCNTITR